MWLRCWRLFHRRRGKSCALQIIDAQKARLKRKLETLQTRLDAAVAAKERADTLVCQLRADLADMSAEREASTADQEQRAQQLQQRVAELTAQLESAARSEDGGVFVLDPDASMEEAQVCLAPGTLECPVYCINKQGSPQDGCMRICCTHPTCRASHVRPHMSPPVLIFHPQHS